MVHIWSRNTLKFRGNETRVLHRADPGDPGKEQDGWEGRCAHGFFAPFLEPFSISWGGDKQGMAD